MCRAQPKSSTTGGGTNVKERTQRVDTYGDISCMKEHSDASAASLLQH